MPVNFKGGIQPDWKKENLMKKAIEEMDAPREVVIPLLMHKGIINNPTVNVGDRVLLGQKIGECASELSAPVFASVSGTVTAIEPRLSPSGEKILSVVIENDFRDEHVELPEVHDRFRTVTLEELALIAREAGLVGMSGSVFPLSEKLLAAEGKVDTLIINGAECEPYVSSDNRMMIEYTEEVYNGALACANALGIRNIVLAIASDKEGAIAEFRRFLAKKPGVRLTIIHTKYPQGAEKQLIEAITGREVAPGETGVDAGVFVMNATTSAHLARAVSEGIALTARVVTVAGSAVANPKNLLARIGTPIGKLFDACGGFLEHPDKVIMGGPLSGRAQASLDVPVVKGTNAILAFCEGEGVAKLETSCIRCGKCVSVCPMNLMPIYINRAIRAGKLSECEELHISDCIECGCCAYVCPARISLVALFRTAKKKLAATGEEEKTNED